MFMSICPKQWIKLRDRSIVPSRKGLGMGEAQSISESERRAEAAYAAMYDAPPYRAKDHFEDACLYFGRGIEAARRAGLAHEADRLEHRRKHISEVYDSQFRWVGR